MSIPSLKKHSFIIHVSNCLFFNSKIFDIEECEEEGLDLCVVAGVVDGELVVWPGGALDAVVGAARPVLDGDGLGGGQILKHHHLTSHVSLSVNNLTASKQTPVVLQSDWSALP